MYWRLVATNARNNGARLVISMLLKLFRFAVQENTVNEDKPKARAGRPPKTRVPMASGRIRTGSSTRSASRSPTGSSGMTKTKSLFDLKVGFPWIIELKIPTKTFFSQISFKIHMPNPPYSTVRQKKQLTTNEPSLINVNVRPKSVNVKRKRSSRPSESAGQRRRKTSDYVLRYVLDSWKLLNIVLSGTPRAKRQGARRETHQAERWETKTNKDKW